MWPSELKALSELHDAPAVAVYNWSKFRASQYVALPSIFKTTPANIESEIIQCAKQIFLITFVHKQSFHNESSALSRACTFLRNEARSNAIQFVTIQQTQDPINKYPVCLPSKTWAGESHHTASSSELEVERQPLMLEMFLPILRQQLRL